MKTIIFFFLCFTVVIAKPKVKSLPPVKVGADVLFEQRFDLIKKKRVGLVTNHTAILSNGKHLADALFENKKTTLAALFGPEHGIRGDYADGKMISDSVDEKTGVQIHSLYGKINKPTPEMLKGIDVLLFDIQDVGARFYTYISTMFLCMEAAAENNIHFVVLDRPNPISGEYIAGPIRVDSLKTFVSWAPIPIAHGMTIGELAIAANINGWLSDKIKAKLTVVLMEHWKRAMYYNETKLEWIKPSPNMRELKTAIVYPGTCLIEGINVSEGRGTEMPFEYIGAPWIDGKKLAKYLSEQNLSGVKFEAVEFTPQEIPNTASNPKYKEQKCQGIFVNVSERKKFDAVKTGITIVWAIHKLFPDSLKFRERGFDRLAGTPVIRQMILDGKTPAEIFTTFSSDSEMFRKIRRKAILYVD